LLQLIGAIVLLFDRVVEVEEEDLTEVPQMEEEDSESAEGLVRQENSQTIIPVTR